MVYEFLVSELPGTVRFKKLGDLIRLYLDQPLQWDLEVTLAEDEVRTTRIGELEGSRLGWDTWVFSGDTGGWEAGANFQKQSQENTYLSNLKTQRK